jgi:ABC-2 type transport system permease protein
MNVKDFYHRLWHEAMRAWIIAEKDIRIYYAKPPVLMWGVALPLFLFLSWSVGRNQPLGTLIPGMIAITVFFAASSIGPVIIPWEKRNHTFERLLTAPMSLIAILLGKALAGMVFGIAVAALPLLVGIALGAKVAHGLSLVVGVLFSAGAFASLGSALFHLSRQGGGER